MVNLRKILYLTGFQESIFAGRNAKNRAFGRRNKAIYSVIYHFHINYIVTDQRFNAEFTHKPIINSDGSEELSGVNAGLKPAEAVAVSRWFPRLEGNSSFPVRLRAAGLQCAVLLAVA
jgi:hypothetical protein